jgi:6-phosphogluconolactonase (cycloisomerase 2 family)
MSSAMPLGFIGRCAVLSCVLLAGLSACGGGDGRSAVTQPGTVAYAYVTSTNGTGGPGAVYEFAVRDDGSVAPLAPVSVAAGVEPAAVAVGGGFVYVVNVGDGTISQYVIQADNSLAPMSPAVVQNPGMKTLGVMPSAAVFDVTRSILYVANSGDDTVSQFSIGGDGQLTPLTPATVAAGVTPTSMLTAIAGSGDAIVYVANSGVGVGAGAGAGAGSISQFSTNQDGTLVPLTSTPVAIGGNPVAIAIEPGGAAYVVNNCVGSPCTGAVTQFALAADGELTATGNVATTGTQDAGVSLVVTQAGGITGSNAYVLGNMMGVDTESGALWQFNIASDGVLSPANPAVSVGPTPLAQTLNVDSLYVLAATAALAVPHPVSMGMLFLLAP